MAATLDRVFFNASDLTLNQPETVASLSTWLQKWKNSKVEIVAVADSDGEKDKLEAALKQADLRQYFEDVVSLAASKCMSTGAYLYDGLRKHGWVPREQIIFGSNLATMKTVWLDESNKPRRVALSSTLRVPAGSFILSEEHMVAVNKRIFMGVDRKTTHIYIFKHDQATVVDEWDSPEKVLLDIMPQQERKAALAKKGGAEALKPFIRGRADLAALAGVPPYTPGPDEEDGLPPPRPSPKAGGAKPIWGTPAERPVSNRGAVPKSTVPGTNKDVLKRTITIYDIREDMDIIIGEGPDAGTQGTIQKIVGEGGNKRFRVAMCTGKTTWTTKVRGIGMKENIGEEAPVGRPNVVSPLMAALNGGASPKAPAKGSGKGSKRGKAPPPGTKPRASDKPSDEFPPGTEVEIMTGKYKGKCGTVRKINADSGKDKEYRIELEAGGPSVWVAANIKKASRPLEAEVEVVKIEDLYDIEKKKLGTGAFGSVTKVVNKATKLVRAMKNIRKPMVKNVGVIWKEVAFMRRLDHPNIIRIYDTFEDSRSVYLIMELATGGELFDRIVDGGAFTELQATIVMQNVLRGLFYMHTKKICHRDLKPENFLLTSKDPVDQCGLKIIDFGIAHDFPEEGETLRSRVGSSYYVAPEVLQAKYCESADMWSFGVITFLVLSGSPPFAGETDDEIEKKVAKGVYSFCDDIWNNVSDDAKDFIKKLMVMDWKNGRMTSGQAMAHTWIADKAPKSKPINLAGTLENLKTFQSASKMKKIALQVIANQCSDDQIGSLRVTFQALDINGDGFLTTEELKTGIGNSGIKFDMVDQIVDQIDYNKSGLIDYTEFLGAALDRKIYQREDVCWGAFRVFDKNGDGKISKEELAEVLKDADVQNIVPGDVERMLKEIDKNSDGLVDFEEFMAMMRGSP